MRLLLAITLMFTSPYSFAIAVENDAEETLTFYENGQQLLAKDGVIYIKNDSAVVVGSEKKLKVELEALKEIRILKVVEALSKNGAESLEFNRLYIRRDDGSEIIIVYDDAGNVIRVLDDQGLGREVSLNYVDNNLVKRSDSKLGDPLFRYDSNGLKSMEVYISHEGVNKAVHQDPNWNSKRDDECADKCFKEIEAQNLLSIEQQRSCFSQCIFPIN
ncbi:hypothetical protein swp_4946 [Shewanella piezotolerans WP3]|uniref:Uncharacterized protein n=1 Tax=Shewanella piezotolerans (strain WP3 / JCM 13877) TaxID=225849 RepID=B8CV88_SHEPW|nr:hypothetical protein [Shewanella piezotolerans]ACJ31564.1 hypothetical protein swp_4946 [Shewanella piezotolerans WP3]